MVISLKLILFDKGIANECLKLSSGVVNVEDSEPNKNACQYIGETKTGESKSLFDPPGNF